MKKSDVIKKDDSTKGDAKVKSFLDKMKDMKVKSVSNGNNFNDTMVGSDPSAGVFESIALVQNYRRYFNFDKSNFKPPNHATTMPPKFSSGKLNFHAFNYKPLNYNSEHLFKNFNKCEVRVKKNVVEVINMQFDGLWIDIKCASEELIDVQLKQIKKDLDAHCERTLKLFVSVYGGSSDYVILPSKREPEIGLPREDVWDKIPREMIVYFEPVGKKLYPEKVEYYGDSYVANVLSNTGLNRYSKVVSDCLLHTDSKIDKFMDVFLPVQKDFAENIASHTVVVKEMAAGFQKFNSLLDELVPRHMVSDDVLVWAEKNIFVVSDIYKHKDYIVSLEPEDNFKVLKWLAEKFKGVF